VFTTTLIKENAKDAKYISDDVKVAILKWSNFINVHYHVVVHARERWYNTHNYPEEIVLVDYFRGYILFYDIPIVFKSSAEFGCIVSFYSFIFLFFGMNISIRLIVISLFLGIEISLIFFFSLFIF